MKILHTADWHLGKKIEGRSMLDSQRVALEEVRRVAQSEKVDAVIIAGDVFDTAVPPSEAEELFYEACVALSETGCAVVALAGNHDDEVRLCAARSLAVRRKIYLVGDLDNSFYDSETAKGGEGWLKLKLPGGTLNLALLPYPLESVIGGGEEEYADRVKAAIDKCAEVFSDDGINVFAAHLFMSDGSEEKMLGGARILPTSILPEKADCVLLGHIHKSMLVSKKHNAYYSGSLIPCNFTETEERSVKVFSFGDTIEVTDFTLENVKKLIRIEVASYDEAHEKLRECRHYAEIMYNCPEPVTPAKMGELRAMPAFLKFTPCYVEKGEQRAERKFMTDEELFITFYESMKGEKPTDEKIRMFLDAVGGER